MLQADLWFLSSNIQMGLGPLLSCTHSKYHAYGRFIVSLVHERWFHTPSVTNGNEYVVVSDKPGYLYIFLLDYALPLINGAEVLLDFCRMMMWYSKCRNF